MQTVPTLVYKIATPAAFAPARQAHSFAGMPIDAQDGYIHLSTAAQLRDTLRLHFAGQSGLLVLAIRSADLGAALKWEPSRGGALFPHYYGPLPISAIAWEATVDVAADGATTLPEAVQ